MKRMANVKKEIASLVGEQVSIEADQGRNKLVMLEGKIINAYKGIFTVEIYLNSDTVSTTSFSYSDVLCEKVKILPVNV